MWSLKSWPLAITVTSVSSFTDNLDTGGAWGNFWLALHLLPPLYFFLKPHYTCLSWALLCAEVKKIPGVVRKRDLVQVPCRIPSI